MEAQVAQSWLGAPGGGTGAQNQSLHSVAQGPGAAALPQMHGVIQAMSLA